MVAALLAEAELPSDRVIGAGVAVSAPVRSDAPGFASGVIFPAWANINVAEFLGERLAVPVHVGNDANLGALAEATFGVGRGKRNLFYVMLSEGIGGGVIVDGQIYFGQTGAAGELGHIVVDPDGQVCRCGNRGCLATVAGGAALTAALRQIHGPHMTVDELIRLARRRRSGRGKAHRRRRRGGRPCPGRELRLARSGGSDHRRGARARRPAAPRQHHRLARAVDISRFRPLPGHVRRARRESRGPGRDRARHEPRPRRHVQPSLRAEDHPGGTPGSACPTVGTARS